CDLALNCLTGLDSPYEARGAGQEDPSRGQAAGRLLEVRWRQRPARVLLARRLEDSDTAAYRDRGPDDRGHPARVRGRAGEGVVAEVKTYRADVERDGRFWHIRVPEVGRSTQARHVRDIEPMARDLIAVMEDVPADSFLVDVDIALPDEVRKDLDLSADLRQQAATSQHAAAELTRHAARRLHDDGLTLRDIGKLLDVSHQRAHQLVEEAGDRVA